MTDRLHLPQRYRCILEGLLREHTSFPPVKVKLKKLGFLAGPEDSRP